MLKVMSDIAGWFIHARLSIGKLLLGNTIVNNYHNEVIIICSAIEALEQQESSRGRKPVEIPILKNRIKHRMIQEGIEDGFHALLKKNGLTT